ncbi:hypothetical protein [Paenibacillus brasilensis]|uniref:hypothetical protein n=1 Tax=Paenibacillus brasilensis TaxID=128574 RepID=UPI001AD708A4|nr:hypothetical protein [Paenibacillus brasilensis]
MLVSIPTGQRGGYRHKDRAGRNAELQTVPSNHNGSNDGIPNLPRGTKGSAEHEHVSKVIFPRIGRIRATEDILACAALQSKTSV